MGLSVRYFVAEDDRTVTRVARARYQRWFSEDEALPANRVGRELRLLEIVVEMDHHRVEDVLHILPFRHWVRGDGKLDASAAMRLAGRLRGGGRGARRAEPPAGREDAARAGGGALTPPHSSIRAPTSTTRFGGMPKKSVAELALRAMKMNRRLRQRIIGEVPLGRSRARPR